VWAALPVVLLFLGLPFIKLATLKPKERDSFADVVLMAGATVVILGIGVILMFVPASVDDLSDKRLSGTR
jgi:cyanate permease